MGFLIPLNCLNYFWKIKYLRRVLDLVRLQLKLTYAVNYCSRKSRFSNYNTYFDWVIGTTDVHGAYGFVLHRLYGNYSVAILRYLFVHCYIFICICPTYKNCH